EGWLDQRRAQAVPALSHFVRQAREDFDAVKFTVVSSLGMDTRTIVPATGGGNPQLTIRPVPRGLLVPLYWASILHSRPPVRVDGRPYYSLEAAVQQPKSRSSILLGPQEECVVRQPWGYGLLGEAIQAIELSVDEHVLRRPLVFDQPVHLKGAGP